LDNVESQQETGNKLRRNGEWKERDMHKKQHKDLHG